VSHDWRGMDIAENDALASAVSALVVRFVESKRSAFLVSRAKGDH
jgi:hypothetical protein